MDRKPCADAIVPAMAKAKAAANKVALIRLLPRMREDSALAAAKEALADKDAEVRDAAFRTIVDWPEASAAPMVLDLAKSATDEKSAIVALRGYIRLAGNKTIASGERVKMYASALGMAKRVDEKKQAIAGLADVPSTAAMDLLEQYLGDAALGADAMRAMARLGKSLAIFNGKRVTAAMQKIKAMSPPADIAKVIDETIKETEKGAQVNGYIVAWMMSGSYSKDGQDSNALFDTVFPPEQPNGKAEWKPAIAVKGIASAPNVPVVALDQLIGGNNCVAYLKAQITSNVAQQAMLEAGSDDGVKIWLNGKVVLAANATRALSTGRTRRRSSSNRASTRCW